MKKTAGVKKVKLTRSYLLSKQSLLWVTAFVAIGVVTLLISHAATGSYAIEPEDGSLGGNASSVSDAATSGGKAVLFAASANSNGNAPISAACKYSVAVTPAFCETFDSPYTGTKTQTGDLDPVLWGVSRLGTYTGGSVNGITLSHNLCAGGTNSPFSSTFGPGTPPPDDARICNGQYIESNNDGGSATDIDAYPKQPFNFAGRTGHVVFDVSSDGEGGHAAWPEFLITDEPVPGARLCISSDCFTTPISGGYVSANNEVGFTLAGGDNFPGGNTNVGTFYMTKGGSKTYTEFAPTIYNTITKGSTTAMNHFEVQVSTTRIDVYGTDAGGTTLKHVAGADIPNGGLGFSQGLVWINDVHYNARKAVEPDATGYQYDHSFAWDNLGFDGPKTYRDLGYDVPLANDTSNPGTNQNGDLEYGSEGYIVTTSGTVLPSITGVNKGHATSAKIVMNATTASSVPVTVAVTINGHTEPAHTLIDPFYWETFSIPVPVGDVVNGTNTISFTATGATVGIANISLIMVAGAPVP